MIRDRCIGIGNEALIEGRAFRVSGDMTPAVTLNLEFRIRFYFRSRAFRSRSSLSRISASRPEFFG